jgi:hypothetical protein
MATLYQMQKSFLRPDGCRGVPCQGGRVWPVSNHLHTLGLASMTARLNSLPVQPSALVLLLHCSVLLCPAPCWRQLPRDDGPLGWKRVGVAYVVAVLLLAVGRCGEAALLTGHVGKSVGKKRKRTHTYRCKPLISLVRQEGFEPPTDGLEGRCSIQLSYWRGISSIYCKPLIMVKVGHSLARNRPSPILRR